jgi:hypothetical protein
MVMHLISREQVQAAAGFSSVTRANARLLALLRAGYLKRLPLALSGRSSLYALTNKGAQIGRLESNDLERNITRPHLGGLFIEHQLRINEIYIAIKHPGGLPKNVCKRWIAINQPLSASAQIIPDGYCEIEFQNTVRSMFLEVDLGTEGAKEWNKKTEGYLKYAVSGEFERTFRLQQFRVLVIANSEQRLDVLRQLIFKHTEKIFWLSTFQAIKREGFWAAVWIRPQGDQKHSLF